MRLSKQPALINLIDAIAATTTFNINDVGLIDSGAKDKSAIIARYPEAPA